MPSWTDPTALIIQDRRRSNQPYSGAPSETTSPVSGPIPAPPDPRSLPMLLPFISLRRTRASRSPCTKMRQTTPVIPANAPGSPRLPLPLQVRRMRGCATPGGHRFDLAETRRGNGARLPAATRPVRGYAPVRSPEISVSPVSKPPIVGPLSGRGQPGWRWTGGARSGHLNVTAPRRPRFRRADGALQSLPKQGGGGNPGRGQDPCPASQLHPRAATPPVFHAPHRRTPLLRFPTKRSPRGAAPSPFRCIPPPKPDPAKGGPAPASRTGDVQGACSCVRACFRLCMNHA